MALPLTTLLVCDGQLHVIPSTREHYVLPQSISSIKTELTFFQNQKRVR